MNDRRRQLGAVGERAAAIFLQRHGVSVMGRNVTLADGEIDLTAMDGRERVVVEVRTIMGSGEPLAAFDVAKAAQVARLGTKVGADRVDLVAIRLAEDAMELRWVRGVA